MTDTPDPAPEPPTTETLQAQLAAAHARLLHAELKSHAIRAGIVDLDGLKLVDTSALKLDPDGELPEASALLAGLKRDKPWLFAKPNSSHPAPAPRPEPPKARKATEMSVEEWRAARARLIKGR